MALVLQAASAAATTIAPAVGRATGGFINALQSAASNGTKISSLADLTRPARVEPIALVDKQLAAQPFVEDLLKFGLTTFIGYYLQAVSLIMNVGKIDTLKVFDSLNPYRSQGSIKDAVWSNETYKDGLPAMEAFAQPMQRGLLATFDRMVPSLEALPAPSGTGVGSPNIPTATPIPGTGGAQGQAAAGSTLNQPSNDVGRGSGGGSIGAEVPKQLFEADNLAVGKMVTVELRDGDNSAKIPVLVRLIPSVVPSQALTHIFTSGGRDTWKDRYHLARAGQIRWIKDLMLGVDLVDQHRKALANDQSGAIDSILQRRRNNVMKAVSTGTASMADASNIAVISKATAKDMARVLYGKIETKAVRDRIFDNSYLLILMIVDEQWERVTVYHRGMDMGSDYSFKEIKGSEKNKGPDITEVFKSFHQVLGGQV